MEYIPLFKDPYYEYFTTLENASYKITVRWNTVDEAWYIDLEGITNGVLYRGLKLVGGVNILKPFAILELGEMWLVDLSEANQDPDFDGIGDVYKLLYLEKGESLDITV